MSQRISLPSSIAALLFLLPWFGGLTVGEVSNSFSQCLDFFYNRTPPRGLENVDYKQICQLYKNRYHFASLYRRQHRAPLFSAYKLSPADGKRPKQPWMYEPQLAFSRASPEMRRFKNITDQNVVESQAVLEDYRNSGFSKGHLCPSLHQKTMDDRESTFTLTNIVPQQIGSNSGPWSTLENELLARYKNFCIGPMYVITGVMPYESETHWINNRVSVPEYMWSAYCCPVFKPNLLKGMEQRFPTYAAVGRNDPNSGQEIVPVDDTVKPSVRGYDVKQMTLEALEGILSRRLNVSVTLFDGNCQNPYMERFRERFYYLLLRYKHF
ncbi:endonuclease domain-containing 1 protein-like [Poeciliopsis prolifica]|uniref:endonuclease domain-containing 1 protein-like n=1 Tax=Poeciliopsis prolifica TaxID=188132 RepID=UPI00241342E2|nr:endonuclease domain-containing 1 protein-like [Poeciliopsis prolifica]